MSIRNMVGHCGLSLLALAWLPAFVIGHILLHDGISPDAPMWVVRFWSQDFMSILYFEPDVSLIQHVWPVLAFAAVIFAYLGLLPALLCRQLWRLGYRRIAWVAGIAVPCATVVVLDGHLDGFEHFMSDLQFATLFLPIWVVLYVALVSSLLWIAFFLIARRN